MIDSCPSEFTERVAVLFFGIALAFGALTASHACDMAFARRRTPALPIAGIHAIIALTTVSRFSVV
jgi:hypothetical protein